MDRPLVSFCLKSYNQRQYILAALEGALAQTYRPLEIVISDDGSTDGSWEAIQEKVAAFRATASGEVLARLSFVLNRNETNLGNLGNWERICELAHGALLVKADGDDVSLPERTERIVSAWRTDGARAQAVCHSGWQIGPRGESYGRLRRVTADWPMGAAMAYSPEVFRRFGKAPALFGHRMDDVVCTRRAQMLGTVLEIPDRLVLYRLGVGVSSSLWRIRPQVRTCDTDTLAVLDLLCRDAETLPEPARTQWLRKIVAERVRLETRVKLVDSRCFSERLRLVRSLVCPRFLSIANYQRWAFLMPRPVGDAMLFAYALARNFAWRIQRLPFTRF